MSKGEKRRRAYVKPEVRKVRLDAEVLLAAICKLAAGTNASATKCRSVAACTNKNQGS